MQHQYTCHMCSCVSINTGALHHSSVTNPNPKAKKPLVPLLHNTMSFRCNILLLLVLTDETASVILFILHLLHVTLHIVLQK